MPSVKSDSAAKQDTLFNTLESLNFGDVHIKKCPNTGLVAIIAIHNTNLGPALGGCRFVHYSDFNSALIDALHLAQGMSFKAAMSGLPHGGGKAVIMAPSQSFDRKALFLSFGEFVHQLGGRYITAEDCGVTVDDMDVIQSRTPFVTGTSDAHYHHHDPSPLTALGVRRGIQAAVQFKLKRSDLKHIHVAVQGLGKVGSHLCMELHQLGAQLTVSDVDEKRIDELAKHIPIQKIEPHDIHRVECDVYAPCALSFAINEETVHEIKAPIIAGSANNQLHIRQLGDTLWEKGILYAPDYVINAGGLIQVSAQYAKSSEQDARIQVEKIYDTLMMIFNLSEQQNCSPHKVADEIAIKRINAPQPIQAVKS